MDARGGGWKASAFGLHDMLGNAWEWRSDRYGPYDDTTIEDAGGSPSGVFRLPRWCAWNDVSSGA
ncbi:MAG: SUMF1/EgtB/PvdO family nonheme iron enzyme [Planctomycetaceae bacterium]